MEPTRAPINLDAVKDELPKSDVIISTAILHHTEPKKLLPLFENMARSASKAIVLVGPSTDSGPLFGDHKYHIDVSEMKDIAEKCGWYLSAWNRSGLREPFAEVMMTFKP